MFFKPLLKRNPVLKNKIIYLTNFLIEGKKTAIAAGAHMNCIHTWCLHISNQVKMFSSKCMFNSDWLNLSCNEGWNKAGFHG